MTGEATTEPLPIFVYGTLMPGQPNDFLWQDAIRTVEAAQINDCCLYDYGYYPLMVKYPGQTVHGQLVWVTSESFTSIIQNLDYFEGFDPERPQESNFRREKVQTLARSGQSVTAWAYMGSERHVQGCLIVESGDWADYVAAKDG